MTANLPAKSTSRGIQKAHTRIVPTSRGYRPVVVNPGVHRQSQPISPMRKEMSRPAPLPVTMSATSPVKLPPKERDELECSPSERDMMGSCPGFYPASSKEEGIAKKGFKLPIRGELAAKIKAAEPVVIGSEEVPGGRVMILIIGNDELRIPYDKVNKFYDDLRSGKAAYIEGLTDAEHLSLLHHIVPELAERDRVDVGDFKKTEIAGMIMQTNAKVIHESSLKVNRRTVRDI